MTDPNGGLTHVDDRGRARMVDVGAKPLSDRMARAHGVIRMQPATLTAIRSDQLRKGDVLAVARVAGIMAGKRTAELIPLCHPIPLTDLELNLVPDDAIPGIRAECVARATWKTGVEMEALTAVSVALLTIYDMAKAIDREMRIGQIALIEKVGGKTGHWVSR